MNARPAAQPIEDEASAREPVHAQKVRCGDRAGDKGDPDPEEGIAAMKTRVLIVDDHPLILEGVRRALESVDDFEVVAEARRGSQVLPLVGRERPDLVLMDIRMPELDGLACLDLIRKRYPDVRVVVLSAFTDREHIETALRRGASAYVVKSVNPLDLPSALRQAIDGTVFHVLGAPDGGEALLSDDTGLTKREIDMLKALARGLSNQAIGKEMWVSEQTVKFHLRNIYRKLGVSSRTEAARYAYERGLVESAA
jgi:DNA-binding NarL/FixJ family response regulator